jgi:GDP-L-fucose synthase
VHLMTHYSAESHVNVGSGTELMILHIAKLVANVVGFRGEIVTDLSKPDGTPRKLLDTSMLASLGWRPRIGLQDGLASTYAWFVPRFEIENKELGGLRV